MNPWRICFYLAKSTIGLSLISEPLLADRTSYTETRTIEASTPTHKVIHWHDWGSAKSRDARWKMISTNKDLFTQENCYAYVELIDTTTKKSIFKSPSPALTYIWISPDSEYIVGISKIKLWNPIQIVVFDKSGRLLLKQAVTPKSFPGVSESVTNWIFWYAEPNPEIKLRKTNTHIELLVQGNGRFGEILVNGETKLGMQPEPGLFRKFNVPLASSQPTGLTIPSTPPPSAARTQPLRGWSGYVGR